MQIQQSVNVITLDGPSGTGKGTIGRRLAESLGWHFLDSGLIYRALAYSALQAKLDLSDPNVLAQHAREAPLAFIRDLPLSVLEEIRSEACGQAASRLAIFPLVRKALFNAQRDCARPPGLVADGRDMGTAVFPNAKLKLFLNASSQERAKRRCQQLKAKGVRVNLGEVLEDLLERDLRDSQRRVAPLVPARDACLLDTTLLSVDEVLSQVWLLIGQKLGLRQS